MVVEVSHLDNICRIRRAKIYIRLGLQAPVDRYRRFGGCSLITLLRLAAFSLGSSKLSRYLCVFSFLYSAIASEVFDRQGVGEFNSIELRFRDVDWWKKGRSS